MGLPFASQTGWLPAVARYGTRWPLIVTVCSVVIAVSSTMATSCADAAVTLASRSAAAISRGWSGVARGIVTSGGSRGRAGRWAGSAARSRRGPLPRAPPPASVPPPQPALPGRPVAPGVGEVLVAEHLVVDGHAGPARGPAPAAQPLDPVALECDAPGVGPLEPAVA